MTLLDLLTIKWQAESIYKDFPSNIKVAASILQ